jgi:hypothetical protein
VIFDVEQRLRRKGDEMLLLGFSPGGLRRFGWCIGKASAQREITVQAVGVADHAGDAVSQVFDALEDTTAVGAAAVDGPLVWPRGRSRRVDDLVRVAYKKNGGKAAIDVVQHPHSLRASCVLQTMLLSEMLRERLPQLALTESHPQVLRYLNQKLGDRFTDSDPASEATLCTVSAWAMLNEPDDWFDLLSYEQDYYSPLSDPLGYWMPAACRP